MLDVDTGYLKKQISLLNPNGPECLATLITQLETLNNYLKNPNSSLQIAAKSLLERLYILTDDLISLFKAEPPSNLYLHYYQRAVSLIDCIQNINALITDPNNQEAQAVLEKYIHSPTYEKPKYDSKALENFYTLIDTIGNSVNKIRSLFGVSFPVVRFAKDNFVTEELEKFLLFARQSTKNDYSISIAEEFGILDNKLLQEIKDPSVRIAAQYVFFSYRDYIHKISSKSLSLKSISFIKSLIEQVKGILQDDNHQEKINLLLASIPPDLSRKNTEEFKKLIDNLNQFNESLKVVNNLYLQTAGQYISFALQDLANEVSLAPISAELTAKIAHFIELAKKIIQAPENKENIDKLLALAPEIDPTKKRWDTEKISYAGIHGTVSTTLFGVFLADIFFTSGTATLHTAFAIAAEGLSSVIAGGQVGSFCNSYAQPSTLSEAVENLSCIARQSLSFSEPEEEEIDNIHKLGGSTALAYGNFNKSLNELDEFLSLKKKASFTLLDQQALEVWQSGRGYLKEIKSRINKIKSTNSSSMDYEEFAPYFTAATEGINATLNVLKKPGDSHAIKTLGKIATKAQFEEKEINIGRFLKGALIQLFCVAVLAISVAATIFTGPHTIGPIISGVMFSGVAIREMKDSITHKKTHFGQQLRLFSKTALKREKEVKPSPIPRESIYAHNK